MKKALEPSRHALGTTPAHSFIHSFIQLLFLCCQFNTISHADERISTNGYSLVDTSQAAVTRTLNAGESVALTEYRASVGAAEIIESNGQIISKRLERVDYHVLGAGIHYKEDNKFYASDLSPRIRQSQNEPVVYDKLSADISFSADINEPSSAELSKNGVTTRSGIAGIQYVNRETGEERLVAWVKSSPAEEVNEGVVYEDAFVGIVADVRYVVSYNKIQQDLILYALPDPSTLGMPIEFTDLRVLTEIMEIIPEEVYAIRDGESQKGDASVAPIQLYRDSANGLQRLFNLQRGYAYPEGEGWVVGGKGSGHRHLLRMSIVEMKDRVFLAEEIPLAAIQTALPKLFVKSQEFMLNDRNTASVPPVRPVENSDYNLTDVDVYRSQPGFVIDYINWFATVTNLLTLEAGETYLVTTDLAIDGTNATLIIEPGTIVKLTSGSSINILNGASIVNYGYLHNPAIFTSAHDPDYGQIIPGYGDAPESNLYESAFVLTGNTELEGVRIRYAETGIQIDLGATVEHSIIELGNDGIIADTVSTNWNVTARNILFKDLKRGLTVDAVSNSLSGVYLNTCTMDIISEYGISRDGAISFFYINCSLFASVTNKVILSNQMVSAQYSGVYNSSTQGLGGTVRVVTNNPFQTGTYGNHYLDQSTVLINGGYITPSYWLLTDYSTATNHQADTGTVDIGFHYPSTNDLDSDGLINVRESLYGTSSTNSDSDADGLLDGEEVDTYGTDPTISDTDGDGDLDGAEIYGGSNPLDAGSFLATVSGTVSYSGGQTGSIHVTARTDPGLVLYLNFDQNNGTNVFDQSGATNNGSMFGGSLWTSNGYQGGSVFFDGTNDYIRIPYSPSYNLTQFTASAWVKLNESPASTVRGVFCRHRASYDTDSWFALIEGLYIRGQMWGEEDSRGEVQVSLDSIAEKWGFVTLTFDGSSLKFYTNAGFAGSAIIDGYSGNTYDLLVGAGEYTSGGNSPSRFWHGWIDEVKIHNRALSPIEVSSLYLLGSTITNRHIATISDPGSYTITNIPTKLIYHLDTYRDSDSDNVMDSTEAQGEYSGNLLNLTGAATNINITLTEIDTDEDGMPDWWEIQYGLNPSSGVHVSRAGWWKFDDGSGTTAVNSASSGYNGQLINMSTSTWVSGKLGSALQFDGNNDYVRVPQSPVIITGQQFTASGWVYLESTSNDDYPSIIADFDLCSGAYKGFWLGYDKYIPGIAVLNTDCLGSFVYPNYATTLTGTWTYVATTYDGSTATLYRNGIAVASSSGAFAPANQSELRIGWANDPWANYYWEGKLDDIRLYTSALSSNQVATMYDAFSDLDGDGLTNLAEYQAGTNPQDSNSYLASVSGTIQYSGSETGTIHVLLITHGDDDWSMARSVELQGPGSYTSRPVANNASYMVRAYRDVDQSGKYSLWKPAGEFDYPIHLTENITNVSFTIHDVPSIWGTLNYSGSASGDVHVIAIPEPGWDSEYKTVIPWIQGEASLTGDPVFVSFPLNYSIMNLPPGDYLFRAWIDQDGNEQFTHLEAAGQYSLVTVPVSNRVTGIDFTIALDSDADGIPDWWEMEHFGGATNAVSSADTDEDGLTNLQEYQYGTDPHLWDTDGDGLSDYKEIFDVGSNPLKSRDGQDLLEQNRRKINMHWNMIYPNPLVFTNTPGTPEDYQDLRNALLGLSGHFQTTEAEAP